MSASVVGEPQNALTEKFTEQEWTALKELRTSLPLIFEEAFPKDPDSRTKPIEIWGISVDPNRLDAKASVVLMHFLRARELKVDDAKTMLVSTLRWRAEFDPVAASKEEFPEFFSKAGIIFGKDKSGRPVVYNIYGGEVDTKSLFADVEKFMRWRVGLMEHSMLLLDFETVDQTVQVHDYLGVTMSSRTPESKQAASEATKIFSDHYPEALYMKFFVNVPAFMTFVFWLFKPFLSAKTFAKMRVLGVGPHAIGPEMLTVIPAESLPKVYGGQAEKFA